MKAKMTFTDLVDKIASEIHRPQRKPKRPAKLQYPMVSLQQSTRFSLEIIYIRQPKTTIRKHTFGLSSIKRIGNTFRIQICQSSEGNLSSRHCKEQQVISRNKIKKISQKVIWKYISFTKIPTRTKRSITYGWLQN